MGRAEAEAAPHAVAVIPARFDSTRFPGKVLAPIAGIPMVARVVRGTARASRVAMVCVATDDKRVADVAEAAGATVVMTAAGHATGTDRVAEAVAALRRGADPGLPGNEVDVVINVQGDQPLIEPDDLDRLVAALAADPDVGVATLAAPLADDGQFARPDVVKVVVDERDDALYFSRAPVPYWQAEEGRRPDAALVHVGVYGFRRSALEAFASSPPATLERLEGLEQLRLLARGVRIRVVRTAAVTPSVDRPEDIARVEALLAGGAHAEPTGTDRTTTCYRPALATGGRAC